jgi:two-component system CitB family sensor kinase
MRLQTKLILLICSLLLLLITALAFIFQQMWTASLKAHIGDKALNIAKTVAAIPAVRQAFGELDPAAVIQPIAERIRHETGAEFIVVGNREGIRYSHPVPERIGKPMIGGDNDPVFRGEAIISEAQGSLGWSLRGKVPVYNDRGDIVGVVSVGFLIADINDAAKAYRNRILLYASIALLLGAVGAATISNNVKRSIMGLEPEEISRLYQEKEAVLESIHEGIIAVNRNGTVTLINARALDILGEAKREDVLGSHIWEKLPLSRLPEVIASGKAEFDQETLVGDHVVVASRLPIRNVRGEVLGAVASFRNKSELYRLTRQLSELRQYADGLRAQTHEFSNKLYLISGLIQLESYQEALELITRETDIQQNRVKFILERIPDPIIGGLLVGKINRAQELKVNLSLAEESSFRDVPAEIDRAHLVTIIGNLVDNAMEAAAANDGNRHISVFLSDSGQNLFIEVEDSGSGVPAELGDCLFEAGVSTKDGNTRGYGLALVRRAAAQLGGSVGFQSEPGNGARFTAAIPKIRRAAP